MQIIKRKNKEQALNQLQQRQNDLWNDFWGFNDIFPSSEVNNFVPKVDIVEHKKSFTIKVDLPDVDPEKINVEIDGNTLILLGETEVENEEKDGNFHREERMSGSFYRSFELPQTANLEKTECSSKHGVLKIKIPKRTESKGKKLKIKVEK
jgi:HSP20 family protein